MLYKLLILPVPVYSQFRYDYSYNAKVGGWMKMHTMPLTFFDAFRMCNAEGQPLHEAGYSNFSQGQPDNDRTYDSTGSHCGGIFRNGLLDDLWCTGHIVPFICEKRPDSLITEDEEL
ncbi:unnamed protein product [Diatraea saccharalis]|uniref:C-type lectin domain-containing protein n=1 Tax=Diatraea saccharalis TaxID=40085 RepID=A0A9N9WDL3_9NEOP|nr:unnamed protein product [Diatraea saccharalis]